MTDELIRREIAGIAALEAAIAAEKSPGYTVLFQALKANKQANVEQMSTLMRMAGTAPPETASSLEPVDAVRAARESGGIAAALRALREGARALVVAYADARANADGLAKTVFDKAHGRSVVGVQTLTAHIAKLTADDAETAALARPLQEYFAGPGDKICFRCHFDRPGSRRALERKDEHPYTYICAGCHDDAVAEIRPDLKAQMARWTERAKEARATQQALGRPSRLMAAHTVIRRLSGLQETPPVLPPAKKLAAPQPPPSPSPAARRGVTRAETSHPGDADYVATLFDPKRVEKNW
jgi:hypothetical protein